MEDGSIAPDTMPQNSSDSNLDFNIDELFYDGFWLEATDGSELWQPAPDMLNDLNPTSFDFPSSDANVGSFDANTNQESFSKLTEKTNISGEPALNYVEADEFSASQPQNHEAAIPSGSLNQSTRLWFGPNKSPIRTIPVHKRLVQAIDCLKDSTRDKDVLIQIWIPVNRGGRQVLTTKNQPFSLNPHYKNLADYRNVSRNYQFSTDADSKEFFGLPGRVFLNKLPEWTPDVRFFKREEYPRVNYAQQHDVRGSVALPVFEQGSGICLGVVEIVTASQKVNFSPELENVCKALEAVNLKSSDILSPPNIEDHNETYQGVLTEIRDVLKFICDERRFPLAQTWASCVQQCKGSGCRHSDENYACCVSTIDSAFYVADAQVSGFHEACSGYHLLKGEGVVGKAFLTNQPCFSDDITAYSKTEYPLSHHARVFNLCASAAIRLRSTYSEKADFVLEFFLPLYSKDAEDPKLLLATLSSTIQQMFRSLRVITDEELAQESSDRERGGTTSAGILDGENNPNLVTSPTKDYSHDKGKGLIVSLRNHEQESNEAFNKWDNSELDLLHVPANSEQGLPHQDSAPKTSTEGSGNLSLTIGRRSVGAKTSSEKRRTKIKKTISLQVLRQYYAGSLKEAAMSIGVCPTTLKRICRQHGITRWPSRKIKKVGHSLKKLQVVINSVQGAEGSIQLSSFYNNFPELVSPNVPGSSHVSMSKMSDHLQQANNQPEGPTLFSPITPPSKSPSSSGNHSSSSNYCAAGVKPSSSPVNGSSLGGRLKRAQSEIEFHENRQDKTKLLIRSHSHKNFADNKAQAAAKYSNHVDTFRVKAALGEENIRLSLQPQWGFKELQEEVLRRFSIDNFSSVSLKYLDDDAEWVLLTCDADLEECVDIHRSSNSRTIKISVTEAYHPHLGSSFGSSGPY